MGVEVFPGFAPDQLAHRGFPFGDRSRFVQNDGIHLVGEFQALGVLNKDVILRPFPHPDHDGRGRGQAQRAGTGDHQHGDGGQQRVSEGTLPADQHPARESQDGDAHDHRNENARNPVDQLLDRGLAALGLLHHLNYLGQHGVTTYLLGPELEATLLVDGTRKDFPAFAFFDGNGFAADHALVHEGAAAADRAVHGNPLAGPHQDYGSNLHLRNGDFLFHTIHDDPNCFRL